MNDLLHLAHGLAGDETPPDWPTLTVHEVEQLLRSYPQLGAVQQINWHSPRPLSAGCLVEVGNQTVFVKRHHLRVRTVATLTEEHRFVAHLRGAGVPIPAIVPTERGTTAVGMGDWVYEVQQRAAGADVYRETISWEPLCSREHALTAGQMLARLHEAANGYDAAQRATHILVARSEIITARDPAHALREQLPQRPGLADYLRQRPWQADLAQLLAPWHAAAQPALAAQSPSWTHGDWHVSNLCWSSDEADACITDVLDFGLCARTFALFDLATAIERNAIAWLELDHDDDIAHLRIALALIEGYRRIRPLSATDLRLLSLVLPMVHVDFALSEVEYYHAITQSRANADVAYDVFLCGHAAWFRTAPAQALLRAVADPDQSTPQQSVVQ